MFGADPSNSINVTYKNELQRSVVESLARHGFLPERDFERVVVATGEEMETPYTCNADVQVRLEGIRLSGDDGPLDFFDRDNPTFAGMVAAMSEVLTKEEHWAHNATGGESLMYSRSRDQWSSFLEG